MKIKKPYNFIPYKKFPDKYFDWETEEEFLYTEINKHPEWYKEEYDNNGKVLYRQYFNGEWYKYEYNEDGKVIYWENSYGRWIKYEYDNNEQRISYEDSYGEIIDYRV
jgi:phage gpG-like protein